MTVSIIRKKMGTVPEFFTQVPLVAVGDLALCHATCHSEWILLLENGTLQSGKINFSLPPNAWESINKVLGSKFVAARYKLRKPVKYCSCL